MNFGKDITGKTVGYLKAVRRAGRSTRYGVVWRVRCRCGSKLEMEAATFLKKPRRSTGIPKSCGCYQKANRSHRYKGVGDLSSTRWNNIRKHAQRKSLKFEITMRYAWNLYLKQGKRCALSGVPLTMSPSSMKKGSSTASLDRKDSSRGYVPGNVQWVHLLMNDLKGNLPQDVFVRWCSLVAEKAQR